MKVVHLWDQANFVKNLMNLPNVNSFELEHFPKLPDFGLPSKLIRGSGRLAPFIYSRLLDTYISAKSRESVYFEFHSARETRELGFEIHLSHSWIRGSSHK